MTIDLDKLAKRVVRLSALRYFPSREDVEGRLEVVKAVASMAGTWERSCWIIDQMLALTGEWPGVLEMRGVFCHRFRPADGKEATSAICPDDHIPAEQAVGFIPGKVPAQLRDPRDRSLPPGEVGAMVRQITGKKR